MLKDFKKNNYIDFFNEADMIPTNHDDNGEGYYWYIPAIWVSFEEIFDDLDLPTNPKVVDIGAWYCDNLLYLGSILDNPQLHAVEVNEQYNTDMVWFIDTYSLPITLHQQDYSQHDISDYDIIYTFCIANRQPEYDEVNQYILNNMKQWSIWIEALQDNDIINWNVINSIENNDNSFEILYDNGTTVIVRKL